MIDDSNATINYMSLCAHYIHQNPLRAGIIKDLKKWKFSSYLDYMGLRNGTLCNKQLFYLLAEISEEHFIQESNPHRMSISVFSPSSDEAKKFIEE